MTSFRMLALMAWMGVCGGLPEVVLEVIDEQLVTPLTAPDLSGMPKVSDFKCASHGDCIDYMLPINNCSPTPSCCSTNFVPRGYAEVHRKWSEENCRPLTKHQCERTRPTCDVCKETKCMRTPFAARCESGTCVPPTPKLTYEEPELVWRSGGHENDASKHLESWTSSLKHCYERRLAEEIDFSGSLELRWTMEEGETLSAEVAGDMVQANGATRLAALGSADGVRARFKACVEQVVDRFICRHKVNGDFSWSVGFSSR